MVNDMEDPEPIARIGDVAVEGGNLVASGGWCAPSDLAYEIGTMSGFIELPSIRMLRPGTPEWEEHQRKRQMERIAEDSMQSLIHRYVGAILRAQDDAVAAAYIDALGISRPGAIYDVHRYEPPMDTPDDWRRGWGDYRFIGLSLEPRPATMGLDIVEVPMLVIHPGVRGYCYDDWDD